MKVSIASLIYQSPEFAEFTYNNIVKHTPEIKTGEAEFFFVANDATEEVISFLRKKKYPFYINNNPHYSEKEMVNRGYGQPEYIGRVYMGYNYAIKMCKNPLVVLINSDMSFSKDWLKNLKDKMSDNVVLSPASIQPTTFTNPRNQQKCFKYPFGATIKSFNEDAFLHKARELSQDTLTDGVLFMPIMMYKKQAEEVGYYPEGNIHGGRYDIVRMSGDSLFLDKLQCNGIKHVQVNNSFIYHLNEGEIHRRVDNSVFVLGATGMLGRYLCEYLPNSVALTRKYFDGTQLKKDVFMAQVESFGPQKGDTIINAMGVTDKQLAKSSWEYILINSLFPRMLADYCQREDINLIHISTDCVFTGEIGNYNEKSLADENGIYGFSKSLGEPVNCTVIRTSIIGENRNRKNDLLEWVRVAEGGSINGWTNHIWNGVTCLQLAKICNDIINNKTFWQGVKNIFSPRAVNKAELVGIINDVYELGNVINEVEAGTPSDKTLSSIRNDINFDIPDIKEQIIEQKNFSS